jgi:hypothetical protein
MRADIRVRGRGVAWHGVAWHGVAWRQTDGYLSYDIREGRASGPMKSSPLRSQAVAASTDARGLRFAVIAPRVSLLSQCWLVCGSASSAPC